MHEDYDGQFKLIVVGGKIKPDIDSGVGKTNLLTRFTRNEFNLQAKPTIGVDFFWKTIEVDKAKVKAQIWDTAGQERYRAFSSTYYAGAHGAVIVYDIANRKSFDNIENWLQAINNHVDIYKMTVMLVGNKRDLDQLRQIQTTEGQDLARKNNFFFMETSALLDGELKVSKAFTTVLERRLSSKLDLYCSSLKSFSTEETEMDYPVHVDRRYEIKKPDIASPSISKTCCSNI